MCYSLLFSHLPQKNDLSVVNKSLKPEGPLGSYLCDVTLPAQLITCQFLFCGQRNSTRIICHKSKKNSRGSAKAKPGESKKGKNKISSKNKEKSSSAKKAASKQPDNSVFGVENLTQEEICQLRELLGYNNQELGVFELYGNRPDYKLVNREKL